VLQAARLAKSIPVSAKVEAILLIFIFTPVSIAYAESNPYRTRKALI
jgi:hypothetical protein